MSRHIDDRPNVVLRNVRAQPKPAQPAAANALKAGHGRERPARAPRPSRPTRKPDPQVEQQTPNANLVFIKNVPQYIATTAIPEMLDAYKPIFIKRIHPDGKTTTIVSGYASRDTAESVREHLNGLRLMDTILHVELYQDERSVQFLRGNSKALRKAMVTQDDEEYDDEDVEYAYEEEQSPLAPPLATSLDFPALPTMQHKEDELERKSVSPAKEWVTVHPRPTPPPIETNGRTILRKTPVATPTLARPIRDDETLSGPTAINDTPLPTPARTPIPKLQLNSVTVTASLDDDKLKQIEAEMRQALHTAQQPDSSPHTPKIQSGRRRHANSPPAIDILSRINAAFPPPPPTRTSSPSLVLISDHLLAPLEHFDTTRTIHQRHRKHCAFCAWLTTRQEHRGASPTAEQQSQVPPVPASGSDQTRWHGMSESQIAERMGGQSNVE